MESETSSTLERLLSSKNSVQGYGRLANLYTGQQNWGAEMDAVEQVFQSRYGLLYILTDPQFKPLRSWTRYRKLEKQIHIPTNLHYGNEITLQSDLKKQLSIDPDKLLYLQAEEKYVEVVSYNYFRLEKHLLRASITRLYEQLPKDQFFRCHRSCVVNRNLA